MKIKYNRIYKKNVKDVINKCICKKIVNKELFLIKNKVHLFFYKDHTWFLNMLFQLYLYFLIFINY